MHSDARTLLSSFGIEVYLFHLVQDFDQSITLGNLSTLAIREEPLHQVIVERVRIGFAGN